MMLTLVAKELRCLLLSPLAWCLLAVMQLVLAWLFLVYLEQYMQIQPRLAALEDAPGVTLLVAMPLLDSAAVVTMLLVPLLSMGMFSRELQSGTIALLLSSPISVTRIVLGKYLALLAAVLAMLLLIAMMPLSLWLGTPLDLGTLLAGLLALCFTLAAFSAVGLYISSLTHQPAVAAVGSYGLLLLLWLLDLAGSGSGNSPLEALSLSGHFRTMLHGLVTTSDISYYLLLVLLCIVLTIHRVDALRSRG